MTSSNTHPAIAIFAYPQVQMSAVLGLADLFFIANRFAVPDGGVRLEVRQVTAKALPDPASESFDAVILPPSLQRQRGEGALAAHGWLRAQHGHGAIMCSICAGAFWLGHAGLLVGRPATTHWALEDEFRAAFPETAVDAGQLLIDDHDIVTAGGLMAWLDLGLFLVHHWLGPQAVSQTARQLLIDPAGRQQRNYRSFRPRLSHGDRAVLNVQHWLEGAAEQQVTVAEMAARAQLSGRTFLRRFKAATGIAPNAYLQNLRIEKARGLLERSRIPVADIGWKVGYGDPSAFSRMFRTATGLTAGEYRKRFGLGSRPGTIKRSSKYRPHPSSR